MYLFPVPPAAPGVDGVSRFDWLRKASARETAFQKVCSVSYFAKKIKFTTSTTTPEYYL